MGFNPSSSHASCVGLSLSTQQWTAKWRKSQRILKHRPQDGSTRPAHGSCQSYSSSHFSVRGKTVMSTSSGRFSKPKVYVREQHLLSQRMLIPGPKGVCDPGPQFVTSRWISGGVATFSHKTQYKTKKGNTWDITEVQTEPRILCLI